MRVLVCLAAPVLCMVAAQAPAQTVELAHENSVDWVCEHMPDKVNDLFAALNLDLPGLEETKEAVDAGDLPRAARALLDYYHTADTASWLREPVGGTTNTATADAVLEDTFTIQSVTAKVPRGADGHLEWEYLGPNNDREFSWLLNRHSFLGALLSAYFGTDDPKFARGYDTVVRDWILSNPYPGKPGVTLPWRGIEVYARASQWARGFFALQDVAQFTPATRLLILTSIPDHAHYLRSYHKSTNNWITMEMNGLATIAAAWPEFESSSAWLDYAMEQFREQIAAQVYPDGVQHELTSHYHRVTLANFDRFADLVAHTDKTLPASYHDTVEAMWNYLAYTMRPDGYGLLNNDSDRDHNAPAVRAEADVRDRPDWAYIATNGSQGKAPEGTPSRFFPWAGQAVMRSGWDSGAQWAFFDVGPLGSGHYHFDKLHLSIAAGGRDLLVDGGRYSYVGGPWRTYFTRSFSHNVLLVDGHGQAPFPKIGQEPLEEHYMSTPEYDLAWGQVTDGYEEVEDPVQHTRAVAYLRDNYWLVVDQVANTAPHTVQALWHYHPHCSVTLDGTRAFSNDAGETNLLIVPSSGREWRSTLVEGQEDPTIQGWWSREYNHKQPSPTVIYETEVAPSSTTFAWLLMPYQEDTPECSVAIEDAAEGQTTLSFEVDGERRTATLTWSPELSLSIVPTANTQE